ncbi:MAG: TIGR01906 family membrane protein [Clostridiales Family XIII bacterium]|jgi:integral membrane protein (TIGR01906 family)|nr:TIGR01906 family membrane protein [Clostridiales Family XIII bacterium]
MKKEKWFTPANVVAALLVAILIISASVTATLFDRHGYYALRDKLDLPGAAGMGEAELTENYDALIDYNAVFFQGPLVFPTLPMSEAGRIHFAEVKAIFASIQIALIVSAIGAALCCVFLLRKRKVRFLALGGILALAIPAVAGSVMGAVGWDRFFVLFHQVFFNNGFWVFDERTDPIILILPDAFFLKCLESIVASIAIASILLIAASALFSARRRGAPE